MGAVGRGLDFLMCKVGYHMKREQFVSICWDMLHDLKDYRGNRVKTKPQDQHELYDIFDSMDFDRSGELSPGEWAGGCSVFFHGNMQDSVKAVFQILDENKDGHLTQPELREYLKPFVKAMMPEGARALQPMLLKRATETIFKEMDTEIKHDGIVTAEEMIKWTAEGKNIIDSLVTLIDREVYLLWQKNNQDNLRRNFNSWSQPDGSQQNPNLMQQRQGPMQQGGLQEMLGLKRAPGGPGGQPQQMGGGWGPSWGQPTAYRGL